MARGPFQGNFQPNVRPTVVTSPDALVYINGESNVIGCPSCNRKFDLHKYITSVQVDLSIDSVPGSANFTLAVPRHAIDDLYFDGVPVLTPMMEVEIYAKGYYLIEGVPQYYPIFWGLITEVSDSYSGGQHTITVNCSDILKWWELTRMNINPAWTAAKSMRLGWQMFGNTFHGTNPFDVIWTLSEEAMGDVVIGTGSLTSYNGEQAQKQTFANALNDMSLYWQNRFGRIRSNLLLYGAQGVAVRGADLQESYKSYKSKSDPPDRFASSAVRLANGGPYGANMVYDIGSDEVVGFKTVFANAVTIDFWQSEYQTKLEIAQAAKDAIGFEFYMDVTGDIVFKPPFYNLDTIPNKPVSWIQDIDIIDWSFSESEAEVVTQITLTGSYKGKVDYGFASDIEPFTSVTDWHLLRKYGWRPQSVNSEFLGDPMMMFYHGLDLMDRLNSRRHRGTVSIPLRPELRLGFPVYVAPKDQVWYVTGISHTIQFGGQAQTTLTLSSKRGKFFAPKGIGQLTMSSFNTDAVQKANKNGKVNPSTGTTFPYTARQLAEGAELNLKVGNAAQFPAADIEEFAKPDSAYAPLIFRHPKTGRACGYPNVVMAYSRPLGTVTNKMGIGTQGNQQKVVKPKGSTANTNKAIEEQKEASFTELATLLQDHKQDAIRIKYMQNRYLYGLNSAGVFVYLHDSGSAASQNKPLISELTLVPSGHIKVEKPSDTASQNFELKVGPHQTTMIRPVSDERGFEVVGHFRYGRGLTLRDGQLVINDPTSAKANISLQIPLGGDLTETLTAQSQGLTTIVTAQPNPAKQLATLTPEETVGDAVSFNEKGEAKEVQSGQKFIDPATLGSQAGEKFPQSLEATALSRALTLAEMTVKYQDGTDQACDCLLGRQDLTFLSQGLRVKNINPLTGTVADNGTLVDQNDPANLPTAPVPAGRQFSVSRPDQVANTVDNYLYSLYSLLDTPHQLYENALRGVNEPENDPNASNFQSLTTASGSGLSPPWNAPERYAVGDPNAIAQLGQSNVQNLVDTWNKFSDDLKRKPVLEALERRSALLGQEIDDLQQQLAALDPTSTDYVQKQKDLQAKIDHDVAFRARVDLKAQLLASGGDVDTEALALAAGVYDEPPTVQQITYDNTSNTSTTTYSTTTGQQIAVTQKPSGFTSKTYSSVKK